MSLEVPSPRLIQSPISRFPTPTTSNHTARRDKTESPIGPQSQAVTTNYTFSGRVINWIRDLKDFIILIIASIYHKIFTSSANSTEKQENRSAAQLPKPGSIAKKPSLTPSSLVLDSRIPSSPIPQNGAVAPSSIGQTPGKTDEGNEETLLNALISYHSLNKKVDLLDQHVLGSPPNLDDPLSFKKVYNHINQIDLQLDRLLGLKLIFDESRAQGIKGVPSQDEIQEQIVLLTNHRKAIATWFETHKQVTLEKIKGLHKQLHEKYLALNAEKEREVKEGRKSSLPSELITSMNEHAHLCRFLQQQGIFKSKNRLKQADWNPFREIVVWINCLKIDNPQIVKSFGYLLAPMVTRLDSGGLPNIGNSCYINSAIRLLLPLIKILLNKPIPAEAPSNQTMFRQMLTRIIQLMEAAALNQGQQDELTGLLICLRTLILEQGSNFDLSGGYQTQQDGASAVACLLNMLEFPLRTGHVKRKVDTHEVLDEPARKEEAETAIHLYFTPQLRKENQLQTVLDTTYLWEQVSGYRGEEGPITIERRPYLKSPPSPDQVAPYHPIHVHRIVFEAPDEAELSERTRDDELNIRMAHDSVPIEDDKNMLVLNYDLEVVRNGALTALGFAPNGFQRKISNPLGFAKPEKEMQREQEGPPLLDISAVYNREKGSIKSRIVGAQIHKGPTPNGGHYVTIFYDDITKQWKLYDDQNVKVVPNNEAIGMLATGYVLLAETVRSH